MPLTIPPTRRLIGLVAAGGVIGSAVRVLVSAVVPSADFPWDVIVVNLAGAFVIGYLLPRLRGHRRSMAFMVMGVGGSATTFSALVLDVVLLAEAGRTLGALGYGAGSVAGGFGAAALGIALGRRR